MKPGKSLTGVFIAITLVVAVALVWQVCRLVDSLHSNVQTTKNIHIVNDNKVPERGKFDDLSPHFEKQIDSMSSTQPYRMGPANLSGSESYFETGMLASNNGKYKEGREALSTVLKLVPTEESKRQSWFADGKTRDKKMYLALTYELRAFCSLHLHDYKSAVKDLDIAISLRPLYGPNFVNRGQAYKLLGEDAKSAADLNTAKELDVAHPTDFTEHALDDLSGHD